MRKNPVRWAVLVVAASWLAGCGITRSRVHASAPERLADTRKVAMIGGALLTERVSRRSLGREDLTDAALEDLVEGARPVLAGRGLALEVVDSSAPEVRALYERAFAVLIAVNDRAYGGGARTRVLDENEYIVSGAEPVLDRVGAGLLLLAFARSEVWSPGAFWSFADQTGIWLAVLDRTGRMIWMNTCGPSLVNVDITKRNVLRRLVGEMLDELPTPGRRPASNGTASDRTTGS
jgi:hypothetical protein